MPQQYKPLKWYILLFKLLHGYKRRRFKQFLHSIIPNRRSLLRKCIYFIQKSNGMMRQLQRFSLFITNDKTISHIFNLQLIVVIEIAKNTPTYLKLQHLYTFFLECYETIHTDWISMMLFGWLFLNYVLYCADILGIQLSLEYSFL